MVLHLVNKEVLAELLNSSDANFAKQALKLLKDTFILNLEAEDLITKIIAIALEEIIEFLLIAQSSKKSEFNVTTLGEPEITSFHDTKAF